MTPLFAVVLSFLILRETFGLLFWMGASLILAGIVLSDRYTTLKPRYRGRLNRDIL
jgi:drug/metabolite transporter (DMT)-like permease